MKITTTIRNHLTRELVEDSNKELESLPELHRLEYIKTVANQIQQLNPKKKIGRNVVDGVHKFYFVK